MKGGYDVYAVGLQEVRSAADGWRAALEAAVGPTHRTIAYVELSGIHLMVLLRSTLHACCSPPVTATRATGFANVMGNKGGAGCSFVLHGSTRLAFVTSHLAARATRVRLKLRCANYADICNDLGEIIFSKIFIGFYN